jgi:predicted PurR-regulated permease PerM
MESKSRACVVMSLLAAFVVMLLLAIGAHHIVHKMVEHGGEKSLAIPSTNFSSAPIVVWGLVVAVGALAKTGASHLLTHIHHR